jgi:signal recognition particle subunit SRP54
MEQKLRKQQFDLEDFLEQLRQVKKMGPLKQVLGLMPGVNAKMLKEAKVDEKQMSRTEAIISSMTLQERRRPEIINGSRRKRIAKGSGMQVADVNRLLKQFRDMKKMMKVLAKPGSLDRLGKGSFPGI